jgi:hypothetical protein
MYSGLSNGRFKKLAVDDFRHKGQCTAGFEISNFKRIGKFFCLSGERVESLKGYVGVALMV